MMKRITPRTYEMTDKHELLHVYSQAIGRRIISERVRRGMTQGDLASATEVAQTAISHLESGWANPTLKNLVRLAHYFEIEVKDFFR